MSNQQKKVVKIVYFVAMKRKTPLNLTNFSPKIIQILISRDFLTDFCTLLQSEFLQNRFISVGRLEPIGLVQKA